jgi:hypothetical protein
MLERTDRIVLPPTAVAITVAGMALSPPVTPDAPYHVEFQ